MLVTEEKKIKNSMRTGAVHWIHYRERYGALKYRRKCVYGSFVNHTADIVLIKTVRDEAIFRIQKNELISIV